MVVRSDFPDYDMLLDAMIASALKKPSMCTSEEEEVSRSSVFKKTTESYEEKRLLTWSMSIFEQPVLMKQYKVYQIYSI